MTTKSKRRWTVGAGVLGALAVLLLGLRGDDDPLIEEPTPDPKFPKPTHEPEIDEPGPTPEPGPEEPPTRQPKHLGKAKDLPKPPTPEPGPEEPPTRQPKHLGKAKDLPKPPKADDPPWSELLVDGPRGASFYQVVRDDRFGGTNSKRSIAYRFLLHEAFLAAVEGGLDEDEAAQWAIAVAKNDKRRLEVIDLIQCSGWNDAAYGTRPISGTTRESATGRSIRLTPIHAPNAELIANKETPYRNATMNGNPADSSLREYELLWGPAINRRILWESGGTTITTEEMVWPDGSTMELPPPWVMALGLGDTSGALEGSFGCPGSASEVEV